MGSETIGFPHCLKVIKEHLEKDNHPVKILMQEFHTAFLYKNRHYLFTQEAEVESEKSRPSVRPNSKNLNS